MLFFTLVLQFYLKNEQKKIIHFGGKKQKKNQNCYHHNIYRWEKGSFFSEAEIRWGILGIKLLKREFKKYLMDLIEINH